MNAIVVNGSVGKTSTLKYVEHILHKNCKINIMTLTFNEKYIITEVKVNDAKVEFNNLDENVKIITIEDLRRIYLEHKVDVILSISNPLDKFFNKIVCGITTIDYLGNLREAGDDFLQDNIPVITAVQSGIILAGLNKACSFKKIPLLLSEHFHLKYIDFDIGLKKKYNYPNAALGIALADVYMKFYKDGKLLDITKYKTTNFNNCKILSYQFHPVLPILKDISFKKYYGDIITRKNVNLYLDTGCSFRGSCDTINWFESESQKSQNTVVKMCIFYPESNMDLIKIMLPISTVNFETLYIVDYNDVGPTYEDVLKIFQDKEYEFSNDMYWVESIFKCITDIMNNSYYTDMRKFSMDFQGPILPKIDILVDRLCYVLNWINKYSKTVPEKEFHILCCGSKRLIDDVSSKIDSIFSEK